MRSGIGILAVLAGVVAYVGAVKGTWRNVWKALSGTGQPPTTPQRPNVQRNSLPGEPGSGVTLN